MPTLPGLGAWDCKVQAACQGHRVSEGTMPPMSAFQKKGQHREPETL